MIVINALTVIPSSCTNVIIVVIMQKPVQVRPKVYLLRHSERLDDTEKERWNQMVDDMAARSDRERRFIFKDCPITRPNGVAIAEQAAQTIESMVLTADPCIYAPIQAIFCSKMRRCVETAYPLAMRMQLPIYISKGLALKSDFEFTPTAELRALCPGVDVLDCDGPDSLVPVPGTNYRDAISFLASAFPMSVVVGHKEIIMNLSETRYVRLHICYYLRMHPCIDPYRDKTCI